MLTKRRQGICRAIVLFFCIVGLSATHAQNFPVRPIRIIVPSIAGSAPDVRARQIAAKLSEAFSQTVIVDNRPGANGAIGALQAAKAQADGYTLFSGLINNAINDLINPNSHARLNHELIPVAQFSLSPLVMVVTPSLSAQTLKEYLQLAKAKPGILTYASAGPGSATQLIGEWIKLKSGTQIIEVPYKSVGAEMPDLMGGQITAGYLVGSAIAAPVKAGKLRALVVAGPQRVPVLSDVPTTAESGLAGVEASVWSGYFAPAATPAPLILQLNRELVRAFNSPEIKELSIATGAEVVGGRPDQFATFIQKEITKWGSIIKEAGIKLQ